MRNPALHQQPRKQHASVIPMQQDASILDWLEGTGRLLSREVSELELSTDDDQEITELMSGDDNSFDIDDDDDDSLDLDD
ncbi:DUF3134 domain-containing protein [Egbenema bharatensis]|uniref:DUF3134 domain-containing protein n=1 Tax=Egbenema bharatensis TaxID=3463334 RepID=UPI003A89AD39